MKKKMFGFFAIVIIIGSPINSMAISSENFEYCAPCNLDSNESNGECFCDAIRLYHAYMHTFGDRQLAVEAGASYLTDCTNEMFGQ